MATCFFLTPFSGASAGGEDQETYELVQDAVASAAVAADVELRRADDIFAAGVVIDQIRGEIERADLIVAVVTGRNANVFYELGLAEAIRHKPILIAASEDDLPFDVQHWRAQLYGLPGSLDDLSERVTRAIVETLEAAQSQPLHTDAPQPEHGQEQTNPNSLAMLRSDDQIGFIEEAKRRIRVAGQSQNALAIENWEAKPSDDTLNELSDSRYEVVNDILEWLLPAVEYKPEWLTAPIAQIAAWFDRQPESENPQSYQFWQNHNQPWVALTLRSLVGASLAYSRPEALSALFVPQANPDREVSPLIINPSFTWAYGYHGNSDISFKDFEAFATESAQVARLLDESPLVSDSTAFFCGTDVVLGMARSVFDSDAYDLEGLLPASAHVPETYASFAVYWCHQIKWACRLLETAPGFAEAVGSDSLESFRSTARAWYPFLVRRTQNRTITCDSWEQATT